MKKVKLHLHAEGPSPIEEEVIGHFEDGDLERFKRFVQYVSKVRKATILQRGLPALTMHANDKEGLKITCAPVADSELHELLHLLRPLILQKETCSFQNIAGLFGAKFDNKHVREELKRLRQFYENGELSLFMQIRVGDTPLFADQTLKLWLNGEEYHTDMEKAKAWKELEEAFTVENTRALVITLLQSRVIALFRMEYLVNLVLQDPPVIA